jgi:hypothetical protein
MVEEFRAPVAEKLNLTLEWLIEENLELYRKARAAGQLRDACEGLKELGVLWQAHRAVRTWRTWRIRAHERRRIARGFNEAGTRTRL